MWTPPGQGRRSRRAFTFNNILFLSDPIQVLYVLLQLVTDSLNIATIYSENKNTIRYVYAYDDC